MGSPFRVFPSHAAVATSRWPVPSCRCRLPCKHSCLPVFRALLHVRVRCRPPMFPSGRPSRYSPGLHPLQGSHPPRRDFAFTKSPLQRPAATAMWEHTQLTLAGLYCRFFVHQASSIPAQDDNCPSEFQRTRKLAPLSRDLPTLLRSLNRLTNRFRRRN
jgi:hypothetical protein